MGILRVDNIAITNMNHVAIHSSIVWDIALGIMLLFAICLPLIHDTVITWQSKVILGNTTMHCNKVQVSNGNFVFSVSISKMSKLVGGRA